MPELPPHIETLRARLDARLIETHISWVLVADDYAYKIKKPVNLGFLDFSTLERRHFCCQEEIRLNRRLAPEIYLSVEPVTEQGIGGSGQPLDWAVRMRAFDADATLDQGHQISPHRIDAIADQVADFHDRVEKAPADSGFGTPEAVFQPIAENFRQIRALHPPGTALPRLDRLEKWTRARHDSLAAHLSDRKQRGFVRECHGDLHLGNIAWFEERPLIFDCIEFNPALRFIDVISEVAFLGMDLASRGRDDMAWRFLNRWLEHSGDYPGLAALSYYQVYRAMVRAKVNFIRAAQEDNGSAATELAEAQRYLELAERLSRTRQPALLLMHGLSGSGKTWLAQMLLEVLGAVRLRSDAERKRLFGLKPLDDSSAIPGGIYTPEAGRRTFEHLRDLAGRMLELGLPVIVDATFLAQTHRRPFLALARERDVPARIVSLEAEPDLLRARVAARSQAGDDASEADVPVLEAQLLTREPLTEAEAALAVSFRADGAADWPERIRALQNVLFPRDGVPH